ETLAEWFRYRRIAPPQLPIRWFRCHSVSHPHFPKEVVHVIRFGIQAQTQPVPDIVRPTRRGLRWDVCPQSRRPPSAQVIQELELTTGYVVLGAGAKMQIQTPAHVRRVG